MTEPFRARAERAARPASRRAEAWRTGLVASYSASELAQLAGVSNATVTRFVRRLGYPSCEEARRHAREERATGSRLYLGHAGEPSPGNPAACAETDADNLRRTIAAIDPGEVDRFCRALLAARKVWGVGFRAPGHLFSMATDPGRRADTGDSRLGGQTMGEHLASIGPQDVVIAFGLRRRVAQLDAILDAVVQYRDTC